MSRPRMEVNLTELDEIIDRSQRAAERDLLDRIDKFPGSAFSHDPHLTAFDSDSDSSCGECPGQRAVGDLIG